MRLPVIGFAPSRLFQKMRYPLRTQSKALSVFCLAVLPILAAANASGEASEPKNPVQTSPQLLSEKLNIDLTNITVSGLSSGGFMATQMHIAHSDWIKGAGIIAAAPYYCARNSLKTALSDCIGEPKTALPLTDLSTQINAWETENKIAALSNLQDSKVWIFGGTLDKKVGVKLVSSLSEQYQQWVKPANVTTHINKPFSHHFPTQTLGTECKTSAPPFIGNCRYDAAGELLNHLYPQLNAPSDLSTKASTNSSTKAATNNIRSIDTRALPQHEQASLSDTAYVYVPSSCQSGVECRVHVSFHGCNQNADAIGLDYVVKTGLNPWAESNKLVVVYPQTKSSNVMPFNPQGCWDWWGYTDEHYATRNGKQIQAVTALLNALKKH